MLFCSLGLVNPERRTAIVPLSSSQAYSPPREAEVGFSAPTLKGASIIPEGSYLYFRYVSKETGLKQNAHVEAFAILAT
jgi:hypothetical protein